MAQKQLPVIFYSFSFVFHVFCFPTIIFVICLHPATSISCIPRLCHEMLENILLLLTVVVVALRYMTWRLGLGKLSGRKLLARLHNLYVYFYSIYCFWLLRLFTCFSCNSKVVAVFSFFVLFFFSKCSNKLIGNLKKKKRLLSFFCNLLRP